MMLENPMISGDGYGDENWYWDDDEADEPLWCAGWQADASRAMLGTADGAKK